MARKTIALCPCTPPSTVETFGERISAEACSGKEIAGSLKKMMMAKIALSVNELFKNVSFQNYYSSCCCCCRCSVSTSVTQKIRR